LAVIMSDNSLDSTFPPIAYPGAAEGAECGVSKRSSHELRFITSAPWRDEFVFEPSLA
jgi:hypothetical protein